MENLKKSIFWFSKIHYNGTQNGTPMVPKVSNGTQTVPKMVPKLPDTFFQMMIFHHFSSQKNGHMTTLATILGTIAKFWVPSIFFSEHIPCQLSEKKKGGRYLAIFTYLA